MSARECDLLVAGGGGAGLAAALAAAARGANVLVIEKSDKVGGTYAYSSGLVWIAANQSAARDGIEDTIELAREHITNLNGDKSVPAVLDAYLERGNETLGILESCGVPLEWIPGYPDYYAEERGGLMEGRYLSSPVFEAKKELPTEWQDRSDFSPYYTDVPASWREIQAWGGYGLISDWDWKLLEERKRRGVVGWGGATTGYLLAACLKAGVEFQLESIVTAFDQDPAGRVIGATVRLPGGEIEHITAHAGVVLSTGGYEHNREMQRQFDQHPPATPFSKATVDGSGVQAAMNVGASFANILGQLMSPVYVLPREDQTGNIVGNVAGREPSFPGSLVVNMRGKRFADDSFYRALVTSMGHFDTKYCRFENLPCYMIFDEVWKDTYRLGHVKPGEVPSWMPRGRDARELAVRLGLPAAELEATITKFNQGAAAGRDEDFGRGSMAWARNNGDSRITPNPCVRPLEGTLYAVELKLGTMGTLSGLAVDEHARVLRADGSPIQGLYACGQSMAAIVEGYWYNSGTSNGRALIFGYIAANHALGVTRTATAVG
jgi:3-oxosteroid 1-dehydrogenase